MVGPLILQGWLSPYGLGPLAGKPMRMRRTAPGSWPPTACFLSFKYGAKPLLVYAGIKRKFIPKDTMSTVERAMEETPCRIPATEDEKTVADPSGLSTTSPLTHRRRKKRTRTREEQRAMALIFTTAAGRLLTTKVGLDDIVTMYNAAKSVHVVWSKFLSLF